MDSQTDRLFLWCHRHLLQCTLQFPVRGRVLAVKRPRSQNSELCECAGMEVVAKPEEYCPQKPNQLSAVKSLRCDIYAFCGRGSFSTIATRRLLCSCSIWYATARLVTVAVRRRPEVRRSADACGTVPANHRSRSSDDPSSRNSPPERSSARVCFPASRNSSGNSRLHR